MEGEFDGIELQLGHSSLMRQFLSPLTNHRQDAYGGSMENRCRFVLEAIDAVRKAIGPDFTLGIRLNADEMHPRGGLTHEDAKQVAVRLEASGQLDFLDLSLGTFYNLFPGGRLDAHPVGVHGTFVCRHAVGGQAAGILHQPDQ